MNYNDYERKRATSFLSIIKESDVDWAIKIAEQLERGDDLRRPNVFKSNNQLPNFEEVTFNIQKGKSNKLERIIPHDSNYYLKPISNSELINSNDSKICDDILIHLPAPSFDDDIPPQKYPKIFPSGDE
ncbi:hypothetical protein M9Y10_044974 [Tritrichomonas musculus]|uniref:Uncharacterized protein n=1 Tax=Tritrichomonas musculus TaxID=1915356 RepID=A0ABR2JVT6_9EUKA